MALMLKCTYNVAGAQTGGIYLTKILKHCIEIFTLHFMLRA